MTEGPNACWCFPTISVCMCVCLSPYLQPMVVVMYISTVRTMTDGLMPVGVSVQQVCVCVFLSTQRMLRFCSSWQHLLFQPALRRTLWLFPQNHVGEGGPGCIVRYRNIPQDSPCWLHRQIQQYTALYRIISQYSPCWLHRLPQDNRSVMSVSDPEKTVWLQVADKGEVTYYDSVTGKPLFIAPRNRTWKVRTLDSLSLFLSFFS